MDESVRQLDEKVDHLSGRVDNLEDTVNQDYTNCPDSNKRVRKGGDRAAYMKIDPEHMATKDEWCKPGAVMGLFPRGIAPINADSRIKLIMALAVYSSQPDTMEEHPEPSMPHKYAPVVLVSERINGFMLVSVDIIILLIWRVPTGRRSAGCTLRPKGVREVRCH